MKTSVDRLAFPFLLLSDLFVVYNEQPFTTPEAPLPGRAIIVKFTQMMAF